MNQSRRAYNSFVKKLNKSSIRHMDYKIIGEVSDRRDLPEDWVELMMVMFNKHRKFNINIYGVSNYICTRTVHVKSGRRQSTGLSRSLIDTYNVIRNHYLGAVTLEEYLNCIIKKRLGFSWCSTVQRMVYVETESSRGHDYIRSVISGYKEAMEEENALIKTEE